MYHHFIQSTKVFHHFIKRSKFLEIKLLGLSFHPFSLRIFKADEYDGFCCFSILSAAQLEKKIVGEGKFSENFCF